MSGDSPDPGPTLSEAWADACRRISEAWQRGVAEGAARRQASTGPAPGPGDAQEAADRLGQALADAVPHLQEALDAAQLGVADALAEARRVLGQAEDQLRWQVARPRDTDPT